MSDLIHRDYLEDCQQSRAALAERLATVEAERDRLRELCQLVWVHCAELEQAWLRGALSEHDGKGGMRSNRNASLVRELRAALEQGREA